MENTAALPVVIPLTVAALLVVLEKIRGQQRWLDLISIGTALAALAFDLLLMEDSFSRTIVYWFGGWYPLKGFTPGIAFVIDPPAAALAALAALLTAAGLVFSWHYFKIIGTFYHSLMLLFLASMEGFCLSGDLFNMFVFFELMGVAAYALTAYKIEDTGPLEGALNFAVMNSVGAFMVLLGIGLIYAKTGALNLAWVGSYLSGHGPDTTLTVAFMLLVIGFLVKGAAVPFHFWLPDAHSVAPTPASVLFSGIMVQLGLYAIARIYWSAFSPALPQAPLRELLLCLAGITAVVGAFLAFLQRHLKRLLAYSTVSHSGMILAGIALFDPPALGSTALYVAGHGLIKAALFICSGIILYHCESVDEEGLKGRCRKRGVAAVLYAVAALALAGLPPFATAVGKGALEARAHELGQEWMSPVFLVASAVTGAAVLRAGASIFFGWGSANFLSVAAPSCGDLESPEDREKKRTTPRTMWVPALLLIIVALAAGVIPQVAHRCAYAAARFTDFHAYQSAVLKGVQALPTTALVAPPHVAGSFAATILAVALAAVALLGVPLPGKVLRPVKKVIAAVAEVARNWHSGYVGDYITWFMAGAAVVILVAINI